VIEQRLYWLAVVAVLNTVVSLFYYARIVRVMFLESPSDPAPLRVPRLTAAVSLILAAPTTLLILYWDPLAAWARRAAESLL